MNKKLTIGYISPRITYGVHLNYYLGILNGARENGLNLLSYIGASTFNYYETDKYANAIFDLINSKMVDGLICWSSVFYQNDAYLYDIEKFIEKNKNIPFVCIGRSSSGLPAVSINNNLGIDLIMKHLIENHGYRKIAFIRGPENHNFAEERLNCYKKSLNNYGLTVIDNLISKPGDFNNISGINAVKLFLDEYRLKPSEDIEAIVTASDLISAGAVQELKKRKIKIPKEIAVVGLNNREESLEISPQLTTIDFQFSETARIAVKTLLSIIKNEPAEKLIYVPPKIIIRESCGCLNKTIISRNEIHFENNPDKDGNISATDELINKILKQAAGAVTDDHLSDINRDHIKTLLNALSAELYGSKENEFIQSLNNIFYQTTLENINLTAWENLISAFYLTISSMINDRIKLLNIQTIFQNARITVFLKFEQQKIINDLKSYSGLFLFPSITSSIVSTFDVPRLMTIMENELPKLGIKGCYISLCENCEDKGGKSQLIMAFNEKGRVNINYEDSYFNTEELLPYGYLKNTERYELIVKPLFFNETQIGLILFHESNIDINTYFAIRSYVSSALQGATLVKNSDNRSKELEHAYRELEDNQKRLLISEKMASLGKMTAGIAHEMNTPLAAARNSSKELELLINEYSQSIGNPEVALDDHKAIAGDMQKCISLVNQSLEKTVSFIKSIKSQTYNQNSGSRINFNATKLVRENILLLEFLFKKNGCRFIMDLENDIFMTGEPHLLNQIISNLLINAVDACKGAENAEIRLSLKKSEDRKIHLQVIDNGCGIGEENLTKIFDPFFTTKPFGEGTGLGLSIVHEIVIELNGLIEVKSKPGETVFSILLNDISGVKNGKN